MTEQIREQLSALLDGELPRDEVGLLLRRLDRDPELRRSFGSYALIGETLRAPGGRVATNGFAARVSAAIAEPTVESAAPPAGATVPPNARLHVLRRPMVRTALAASAAAVAVVLFRPDASGPPFAAVAQMPADHSPTPAHSQRLASYMVAHSQFATPMVRRNVLTGLLAADPGLTNVSYEFAE